MQVRITTAVAKVLKVFLEDIDQERYGFELMQRSGLASGTLYPILARLESAGWIVGQPALTHLYLDDGRQRVYDVPIRNPRHDNPDPHSEVGYLESLQTSGLIQDFLLRQR